VDFACSWKSVLERLPSPTLSETLLGLWKCWHDKQVELMGWLLTVEESGDVNNTEVKLVRPRQFDLEDVSRKSPL
jgi:hypothetical protein